MLGKTPAAATEVTFKLVNGTGDVAADLGKEVEISTDGGANWIKVGVGADGSFKATIPAGSTSGIKVSVPTVDDDLVEGNESIRLEAKTADQEETIVGEGMIIDNDTNGNTPQPSNAVLKNVQRTTVGEKAGSKAGENIAQIVNPQPEQPAAAPAEQPAAAHSQNSGAAPVPTADNGGSTVSNESRRSDSSAPQQTVSRQSVILPSYHYPEFWKGAESYWDAVHAAGSAQIPFVVINPASGPGKETDRYYSELVARNAARGMKSIGYIRTGYGNRPVEEILAEVDAYHRFYSPVAGFFFDEVATKEQQHVDLMKQVYNYVKTKYPGNLVVANEGAELRMQSIAAYADIHITSEISADEYINRFYKPTGSWEHDPANSNRIWHIVYGAQPSQYDEIIRLSRTRNAGWLFITSDVQTNPYDDLPADFADMVRKINNLGAPDVPMGGVRD